MRKRSALVLALALSAAGAEAREVTGRLDPQGAADWSRGAMAVVQVWGADGAEASVTLAPDGAPPFGFEIDAPEAALLVQAMIRTPDGQRWRSAPSQIPAGGGATRIADLILRPAPQIGFTSLLACGPALVEIGFHGADAFARRNGDLAQMTNVGPSLFSDGRSVATELDSAGPLPRLTWVGRALPACTAMPDPAKAPVALIGAGWSGQLEARPGDGRLDLRLAEGRTFAARHPQPDLPFLLWDAARWVAPGGMDVALAPGPCRLPGQPLPFPAHVDLSVPGQRLFGCAGAPGDLLQGDWRLLTLEGAVLERPADLRIGADMAVQTGCNILRLGVEVHDAGLRLTPGGSTRRACPAALQAREARLATVLAGVDGFDIDRDGRLVLLQGGTPRLTLTRP